MKKLLSIILSIALLTGVGCDDFGDTNVNPNASVTPLTSALLTYAESALGGATTGGANFNAGLYAQYFSQTQYTDASLYSLQDVNWGPEYYGTLNDLQKIIDINTDEKTAATAALQGSNNNQIAIARILKAYRFSILTDRYGDIPYFEALKGETQPTVDSQESIYSDLFKELKEAVAQFDGGATVSGDILYSGDNDKWKKFANSLRLVLALRISKANATLGKAEFNEALAASGGVFSSNDDNAKLVYPGGAYQNPWFAIATDQGISDVVANRLNTTQDMRKNAFGNPNSSGTLVGVPYGLKREAAIAWVNGHPDWSLILDSDNFRTATSPLFILTYADALLARVEAAQKGWTTENFVTLYSTAMQASWNQWGVYDAAAFTTFMAQDANNLTTGNIESKIATQRWLTFYPNGPQGWAEWRRTGFPTLTPTPDAVNTSKQIPLRFAFPTVEYSYNGVKLTEAAQRMGGDTDAIPVWWDK